MMFKIGLALAFVGLEICSQVAQADDRRSVEYLLQGCRFEALTPAPVQDREWSEAFQCRDALAVAIKVGPIQPKMMSSCVPESLSPHSVAKAVVQYLEQFPERYRERFDMRAATALHHTWPCP